MIHPYRPPDALKAVVSALDSKLVRVLCDLARLYVCMRWAKQDNAFLDRHPERGIHLVADADVAINWAYPEEERSMMRLFDNELIGARLSEHVGRWLFVNELKQLPPTRMFQGHAREVNARVQTVQHDTTDRARAITERILQRDRPFTPKELEEIERFIEVAEVETGFTMRSEIEDIYGEVTQSRGARSAAMKLNFLLRSPRVRPMARDWIASMTGDRSVQDEDIAPAYEAWRTALNRVGSAREAAVDADAAALAYVDVINENILARRTTCRVVFLTGSSRIYRAGALLRHTGDAEAFHLRHPLCFLFATYSPKASDSLDADGKEWTAYGNVFESFLQRVSRSAPNRDAVFAVAYYLAWSVNTGESRDPAAPPAAVGAGAPPWIVDELHELHDTGVRLVTAQALSFRAEQLVDVQASQHAGAGGEGPGGASAATRMTVELDLLHKLRYLETSSVDALLQKLVGGVLSNSLSMLGAPKTVHERWRKVPILVFGENDTEFQAFAIQLRNNLEPTLLSAESLNEIRAAARRQRSRYLALVLDALVLAAFGEWAAAASMSRRAIERAEYFQVNSQTRRDFDRLGRSEEGEIMHSELLADIRDVDGREARYMCSHAIRYSAHALKDFEEAARHLRVFQDKADEDDRRGRSEDLALSLAEWTFLKYVDEQQPNIGRLTTLRERLERAHIDFDEERRLAQQAGPDTVRLAVMQYVWEQSTLNLGVALIESSLHRLPLAHSLIQPAYFAETIAAWTFKDARKTSLFARFIAAVTCLHFAPESAEVLCGSPRDQLEASVADYAKSVPMDGVVYERLRARAYYELVTDRGAGRR